MPRPRKLKQDLGSVKMMTEAEPPPPPPTDDPAPTYFSRVVLFIAGNDRLYDLETVPLKRMKFRGVEQLHTPATVQVRGQEYAIDLDLAPRLFGWFPGAKRSWWWTTYKDLLLPRAIKTGFLVYRQPDQWSPTPIRPLDRLADQRAYSTMTPYTNKAFTDSKLKDRYLRSTPFGGLLDSKVLLVVLLGLIAFVIIFTLTGGMR